VTNISKIVEMWLFGIIIPESPKSHQDALNSKISSFVRLRAGKSILACVEHLKNDYKSSKMDVLEKVLPLRATFYDNIYMREKLFTKLNSDETPICACGCGQRVTRSKLPPYGWNEYILGHHWRGKHHTVESKIKISESQIGKKKSLDHRKNLSIAVKKRLANPKNNPMFGKHPAAETRVKMSGPNNANWKGGKSLENRPPELTPEYKQAIRHRDNFQCQFCGYKNTSRQQKLDTRHIDKNRKNNCPDNLITFCKQCHKDIHTIEDKRTMQRIGINLVRESKRLNPEGHKEAVRIYEQNMRVFYKSKVA